MREPERRRSDAKTAVAEGQLRLLLLMDHSLDFLEFVGRGGQVQAVSSAITALAGYAPQELVGRPYSELIHPDDWEVAAEAFKQVLAAGQAGPVTLRYRHKNGSYRTVELTARNFLQDPKINGILVLTRDITDKVAAQDSLRAANDELRRLSRQLLRSQEAERAHLARELHDDVQQMLAGLRYSMASAARSVDETPDSAAVAAWSAIIGETMEHLRLLTLRLRPPALDRDGLRPALMEYIDRERCRTPVKITIDVDEGFGRLEPDVELACFRVVQEGLANATKHSHAAHVRIHLTRTPDAVSVVIIDDGIGFDVSAATGRAARQGRIGLLSIQERTALVGGRALITSSAAHGTTVTADFPTYGPGFGAEVAG